MGVVVGVKMKRGGGFEGGIHLGETRGLTWRMFEVVCRPRMTFIFFLFYQKECLKD